MQQNKIFNPKNKVFFPLSVTANLFIENMQMASLQCGGFPEDMGDLCVSTGYDGETGETTPYVHTNLADFSRIFTHLPIVNGKSILVMDEEGKVYEVNIEDHLTYEELGMAVYQDDPFPRDRDQIITPQGFMSVV